jgi:hypothetical protein
MHVFLKYVYKIFFRVGYTFYLLCKIFFVWVRGMDKFKIWGDNSQYGVVKCLLQVKSLLKS